MVVCLALLTKAAPRRFATRSGPPVTSMADWVAEQVVAGVRAKAHKMPAVPREWEWEPCEPSDKRQQASRRGAGGRGRQGAAKRHRDDPAYRDLRDRCRAMATSSALPSRWALFSM